MQITAYIPNPSRQSLVNRKYPARSPRTATPTASVKQPHLRRVQTRRLYQLRHVMGTCLGVRGGRERDAEVTVGIGWQDLLAAQVVWESRTQSPGGCGIARTTHPFDADSSLPPGTQ